MWAAACRADNTLTLLQKMGANFELKDNTGQTVSDWLKFVEEAARDVKASP